LASKFNLQHNIINFANYRWWIVDGGWWMVDSELGIEYWNEGRMEEWNTYEYTRCEVW
jgi:hypothetical protein